MTRTDGAVNVQAVRPDRAQQRCQRQRVLSDGIFPTIDAAIRQLPDAGEIHAGKLDWRDDSPMLLAEGRILAFSVELTQGFAGHHKTAIVFWVQDIKPAEKRA